ENANLPGTPANNLLRGNHIGADVNGDARGNGGPGVVLGKAATASVIGGPQEMGNLIANNAGPGILVRADAGDGNNLAFNRTYDNEGLGIDLVRSGDDPDGVNDNDDLDADSGPNELINFPTITEAEENGGAISGTLDAEPNAVIAVVVYVSDECDPS